MTTETHCRLCNAAHWSHQPHQWGKAPGSAWPEKLQARTDGGKLAKLVEPLADLRLSLRFPTAVHEPSAAGPFRFGLSRVNQLSFAVRPT